MSVLPFLLIGGAVVLVAVGGLMAALDAALAVTSRSDLLERSQHGRNADALRRISEDGEAHRNAVVFMRILTETTAAVLVTAAFMLLFENIGWAILASALLMTVISFVLVGASPRSVGRQHAEGLLRGAAPVVRTARILLGPLSRGLVALGERVTPGVARGASFASEDQLLSLVDEAASYDLIEEEDRELIHSVFDFTDQYVRAVMVPRTDMVTLDADCTTREAMDLFLQTGVSRVPMVDGDDVLGVLYLKDLVRQAFSENDAWADQPALPLGRPPVFVPESMKAETLLQQMKRDAVHVCMVIDEYGGVSGLVTLEDLIEELVGDISDEYDARSREVQDLGDGTFRVSARLPLDEAGDLFGIDLEDEDVDSIGGLLGKAIGRIPEPGSVAETAGLRITGDRTRGRARGLDTVILERSAPPSAPDDTATGEHRIVGKAE